MSQHTHPVVREAIELFQASELSEQKICEKAGIAITSISRWRALAFSPKVPTLDACLEVLGLELTITKKVEK